MSDTPRTDAAWATWIANGCPQRLKQESEKLERQLAAAILYRADQNKEIYAYVRSIHDLKDELAAANERIKRLEEAFTQLEQCNFTDENCATLEVATKRIRNFARQIKESKS